MSALELFPEFSAFVHPLPFVTEWQNAILVERLARNAMRLSTGCIVWDANCTVDGYGRISLWMPAIGAKQNHYLHRVAWALAHGRDIPHFKEVAHKCNTPPCFNPLHLVLERMEKNRRDSMYNTLRKRGIIDEVPA